MRPYRRVRLVYLADVSRLIYGLGNSQSQSLCMPEEELRALVVRLIEEGRVDGGRITVAENESFLEVPSKYVRLEGALDFNLLFRVERAATAASSAHYDAIRNWLDSANKLSEMCSAMVLSLPSVERTSEAAESTRARHRTRHAHPGGRPEGLPRWQHIARE